MYVYLMNVTRDHKKPEKNLQKHRVRFSDAETVLFDPLALTFEEQEVVSGNGKETI